MKALAALPRDKADTLLLLGSALLVLAPHAARCLGRCPRRPSERLPPSFLHARARSVQPVPREAAHSGCTPGLADGQGFSAALRCAETQAQGRKDP